jgi:integrase
MSVFKRDGAWVVKFKNHAGRWQQQRTRCATKHEAKLYLHQLEHRAEQQRMGLVPLEAPKSLTFGELVRWHHQAFPKWRATSDTLLAMKHLLPTLENRPVVEVTSARIDEVLATKEAVLAPKSLNNLRSWLQGVFTRAIQREVWNGSNPATAVPRRKVAARMPSFLKPEEVRVVLAEVPTHWRAFFATAVYTGMRRGEIAALEARDVDLDAGTITVSRSWSNDTTKTRKARVIPLHPELRPYIAHAVSRGGTSLVFESKAGGMVSEHSDLPALLRSALARAHLVDGWVLKCRRCRCHFDSATPDVSPCSKCGFALWPSAKPRRVRFHDLRHTTATLMLKAGVSLAVVQRVLGHSSPVVTSSVYGHLELNDMRAGIERLSFRPAEMPLAEVIPLAANDSLGAPVVRKVAEPRIGDTDADPIHQQPSPLTTSRSYRIRTCNQAGMSRQL